MENLDMILDKASRCLNCKNARCKEGCPISTNIPEFIHKIKEEKFKDAYYILQENNMFSEICCTVCPVEKQCMGNCIRGIKETPVSINTLERFVNEWANENSIEFLPQVKEKNNKKVAIIGSGPAGLACSVELAKNGFDVTVFEKENVCGGILNYGIPDFRLSKEVVNKVINRIKNLGVKFENNIEFGKDITIERLKESGFDYIFLAMGAQKQSTYSLTSEKIEGIYKSDEFLKKYNYGEKIGKLGVTVVIGGGNVAFDSARAAIRSGAKKVYILYRRSQELMPARKVELDEAIADGVEIIYQTKVLSANVINSKIDTIECIKTEIVDNKAVDIQGSNYKMNVDTVIYAIGSSVDDTLCDDIGIKHENGLITVDENYKTNIENVYAGGDMVETKSSVARAIATGKKVAKTICREIL